MSYFNRYLLGGFVASTTGDSCTTTSDIFSDGSDVALYRMQGNSVDDSGNSNNGTATNVGFSLLDGAQPATGRRFGGGAAFNGSGTSSSTSYIDIPSATTPPVSSISLWFKTTIKNASNANILAAGGSSSSRTGFSIRRDSSGFLNVRFTDSSVGQTQIFTGNQDITDGAWHNVILSMASNNTFVFYLDGSSHLSGTKTRFINGQSRSQSFNRFGSDTVAVGSNSFEGSIDQVRIFNRPLDSGEVTTVYNDYFCQPGSTDVFSQCTSDTVGYPIVAAGGTGSGNTVAFYKLDDEEGSGTAADAIEAFTGQSAVFNGTNSYIDTTYNFGTDSSYSISLWEKTSVTSTRHSLFGVWVTSGGTNGPGFNFAINASNNFEITLANGSSFWQDTSISASSYTDGNWHNLILVINGTSVKIYADGNTTPIANLTSSVSAGTATADNLSLGRLGSYPGLYFNGSIDQVRIFNTALTAGQVTSLYNEPANNSTEATLNFPAGAGGTALYQLDGDATSTSSPTYDGAATALTYGAPAGKGYNGTAIDIVFGDQGYLGTAAVFNGSSSYVYNLSTSIWSSDISISAWFKTTGVSQRSPIIQIGRGSWTDGFELQVPSANTIAFAFAEGSKYGYFNSSIDLDDGNWHHYVQVSNSSTAKFFIDGVEQTGITTGSGNSRQGSGIRIGRFFGTPEQWAVGSIDQVRILDTALTAGQVKELYEEVYCDTGCTTSTVNYQAPATALYRLDGDATDSSTANNGAFTGQSAVFNGTNSAISLGALNQFSSTTVSFSLWFNSTSVSTTAILLGSNQNAPFAGEFDLYTYNSGFLVTVATSANDYRQLTTPANLSNNTWHNVVVTLNTSDTNVAKIYLDGNEETTTVIASVGTISTALLNSTSNLNIGVDNVPSSYFNGSIDQVRIFNTALIQGQVTSLYNEPANNSTEGTLNFPTGAGGTALYQLDGNANDTGGTYNGAATGLITYGAPAGKGYNGTATDIVFGAQGYLGTAAVFNGSTSAINTTYTPTIANLRTISLWFKSNATSVQYLTSVGPYGSSNNYAWQYLYMAADGKVGGGYGANNGGAVYVKTTTASYNDNSWHHVALTLNGVYGAGSFVQLYIDGQEVPVTIYNAFSGATSAITGTFRLGHTINSGVPAVIFNGSIDQVRILDTALTAGQVKELYHEVYCDTGCTTSTVNYQGTTPVSMRFDGDFTDDSGGTDGLSTATLFSPGKFDLALTLSGTQTVSRTLASYGTFNVPESDRTVSMWFKATTISKRNIIWYEEKIGSFNFQVELGTNNRIAVGGGGGFVTPDTLAVDTWYHLAATLVRSTGFVTVYINGSPIGTGTSGSSIGTGANQCVSHGAVGLTGQIDQLKVYGSVLGAGQVSNLYNEISCT